MVVLFIIIAVLLLIVAAVFGTVAYAHGLLFGKRCDGDERLRYFTHEDFDSLKAARVEFPNKNGETLRGAIYAKAGLAQPEALIIFSHGMGGGHLSYMTEINTFAQNGFAVLAFDNTGTFTSDGDKLGGFISGPDDLKAALKFVRSSPKLNALKKVLVGHSWGGFSVCRTLGDPETDICCAVTFGAPQSGYHVGAYALGEKGKFLLPVVKAVFRLKEGKDAAITAAESIAKASAPILLLHGADDSIVAASTSAAAASASLPYAKTVIFDGRAHNVYQTIESEKYMNETFAKINALKKNKNASAEEIDACYDIDYELITREDPSVMELVMQFIRQNIE